MAGTCSSLGAVRLRTAMGTCGCWTHRAWSGASRKLPAHPPPPVQVGRPVGTLLQIRMGVQDLQVFKKVFSGVTHKADASASPSATHRCLSGVPSHTKQPRCTVYTMLVPYRGFGGCIQLH